MRAAAPIGYRMLQRMDDGLAAGSIEGHLPDGNIVLLGGRQPGPSAVIHLNDWNGLLRVVRAGTVGLYEGWLAGEWQSDDPVPMFDLFMRNRAELGNFSRPSGLLRFLGKIYHWARRNNKSGARKNIEYHYDLGNDFYASWLDEGMVYSSGIFEEPVMPMADLAAAQLRKNDLLLDRLNLVDGASLLEIGCGWGSLGQQALERRALHYHGITLSHEQKEYADRRLSQFGDAAQVSITDYRDVEGQYDAVASVEMVEAVGQQYWPEYLDIVARSLKPGGRAAIQYISIPDEVFDAYAGGQDFIQRYIFPGGMLINETRFRRLAEARGLRWCDAHHFGLHYAETLRQWRRNFDVAVEDGRLPVGFDERFVKLWQFYLMYCEGGFRGRGIDVAQVTLVKQ